MNLELAGVCKRFGAVTAVDQVDLAIRGGEVLALLGENGAGKSTLMKLLYGLLRPDAGEVRIDGTRLPPGSPRAARAAGIGMVFQQFSAIPSLTVAENLMFAWPQAPRWLPPGARAWAEVVRRLQELAPELDPRKRAGDLAVGERQLLELAKVLNLGARVVILDEPTSVLARPEAERLWREIRALAAEGAAVVLITHKLDDVAACADRVAVMRAGRLVGETTAVTDEASIVGWMMGGAPTPPPRRAPLATKRPWVLVRDLEADSGDLRLACPTLELGRGEILGIAGVTGNGQELLAAVLAGVRRPRRGEILVDGRDVYGPPETAPAVAYLPEQPAQNGCAPGLPVLANLTALQARRLPWVPRWADERRRVATLLERFDVRPRDPELPARALSGGNLQKLVAARELGGAPELVVACYPTMGLDLTAARDVVAHLEAAAAHGAAVVIVSEDLDLLLARADRVAVLQRGRLLGPLDVGEANRQRLGAWMAGAAA